MKRAAQIGKALAVGLIVFVVGAIVAGVVWWARMPQYSGRSVHHWFARAEQQWGGNPTAEEIKLVKHAFREMGGNAVPFLLEKLTRQKRRPDSRSAKVLLWARSKRWVPQRIKELLPNPFSYEHFTAYMLIKEMAGKAILAQPTLERILTHPGPGKGQLDYEILEIFENIGESASNSAPVIALCFASTNDSVKSGAVRAFEAITSQR